MDKEELQKELSELYSLLEMEISSSSMDIVQEIINLEIELEKECNQ